MDILAGQLLTAEALAAYFTDLESVVLGAEASLPDMPAKAALLSEQRSGTESVSSLDGSSVERLSYRPDMRGLSLVIVPTEVSSLRLLAGGSLYSEEPSRLVWDQYPYWTSRCGHTLPGGAIELELLLPAASPVNMVDPGTSLVLSELWYENDGAWCSLPPGRPALFAPVTARHWRLVLSGLPETLEQGGWQLTFASAKPVLYCASGPLNVMTTLKTLPRPLFCELTGGDLRAGLTETVSDLTFTNLGGLSQKVWIDPALGGELPLPAGTYTVGLTRGGWASQSGASWSRRLRFSWTQDGAVKELLPLWGPVSDPAAPETVTYTITLTEDTVLKLETTGADPLHFTRMLELTFVSATSTSLLRPGDVVNFPLLPGLNQTLPAVGALPATVEREIDVAEFTLSSPLTPSRCWVYAKVGPRWVYLEDLLIEGEQTFQVQVGQKATYLRLFFPPLRPGLVIAEGVYQNLTLPTPAVLQIGDLVGTDLLVTARLPGDDPATRRLLATSLTRLADAPYQASGPDVPVNPPDWVTTAVTARLEPQAEPVFDTEVNYFTENPALVGLSYSGMPSINDYALSGYCQVNPLLPASDGWLVEAELSLNGAIAAVRFTDELGHWAQVTVGCFPDDHPIGDDSWHRTDGSPGYPTLLANQLFYKIETDRNFDETGHPYLVLDSTIVQASQGFRFVKSGRWLCLLLRIEGVWMPRWRFDLTATGAENPPLGVERNNPTASVVSWTRAGGAYAPLTLGSNLLPSLRINISDSTSCSRLAFSRGNRPSVRLRSGSGDLLSEYADPGLLGPALSTAGFMLSSSPVLALPVLAGWLESDLPLSFSSPTEGPVISPSATLALAPAYEGAPGLLQVFETNGASVLNKAIGVSGVYQADAQVELPTGTTVWAMGSGWRLTVATPRQIHLSKASIVAAGTPVRRPGQVRYRLACQDGFTELVPAARGMIPKPRLRPDGSVLYEAVLPDPKMVLADEAGLLDISDYTVEDSGISLSSVRDVTLYSPQTLRRVALKSSMQVANLIVSSDSFVLPQPLYVPTGKDYEPLSPVISLLLDGKAIRDVTNYDTWQPVLPGDSSLVFWTDGESVFLSASYSGKATVTWNALPETAELQAWIQIPEGVVTAWPLLALQIRSAYYSPRS